MNILIVGASGATGRLLTEELLNRGQFVKVIIWQKWKGQMPVIYNKVSQ